MRLIGNIILAGCLGLMAGNAFAQDTPAATAYTEKPYTWTLQDCINWAKQQSVTVQRNKVRVRSSQIDVKDAKGNRLPHPGSFSNHPEGAGPSFFLPRDFER